MADTAATRFPKDLDEDVAGPGNAIGPSPANVAAGTLVGVVKSESAVIERFDCWLFCKF